ncbi:MAG: hypothetical protein AAGD86_00005, partial [Pseudomonadota bacterium]
MENHGEPFFLFLCLLYHTGKRSSALRLGLKGVKQNNDARSGGGISSVSRAPSLCNKTPRHSTAAPFFALLYWWLANQWSIHGGFTMKGEVLVLSLLAMSASAEAPIGCV